jgi:hypothetical protein
MADLLAHGQRTGLSITTMLRANENCHCSDEELNAGIDNIWAVMKACIARGLQMSGELPGGLQVQRRAANLWRAANSSADVLPHDGLHRVSLYAMAVNEENAAGGRVVTARPMVPPALFLRCCAITPKTVSHLTLSKASVTFCSLHPRLECCAKKMPPFPAQR